MTNFFSNSNLLSILFNHLNHTFQISPGSDGVAVTYAAAVFGNKNFDPVEIEKNFITPWKVEFLEEVLAEIQSMPADVLLSNLEKAKKAGSEVEPGTFFELFYSFCVTMTQVYNEHKVHPRWFDAEQNSTYREFMNKSQTLLELTEPSGLLFDQIEKEAKGTILADVVFSWRVGENYLSDTLLLGSGLTSPSDEKEAVFKFKTVLDLHFDLINSYQSIKANLASHKNGMVVA